MVVALRRDRSVKLADQLEEVLGPFMYDPALPWEQDFRCDGWLIGGHWAGHFLSIHRGDPDLVNGLGFPLGTLLSAYAACDGGPKGLLDLDHLRRRFRGLQVR